MQSRAYSFLDVKAMEETADYVSVKGVASTPTPDRMGDIVDPMGAKFITPMPLLWQHDHTKPVGHMTFAKPGKAGIPFEASIPRIKEAGTLQDRVNEAIHSLQYKLVAAVSIGFRVINDGFELLDGGGLHFKEWEWLELSLVTIPANSDALISAVKSADQAALSAIGKEAQPALEPLHIVGAPTKKRQPTGRRPILLNERRYTT